MGVITGIVWCHHTFNCWWGCTRVSPGCENCYAEEWAARFGVKWGTQVDRRFFGQKYWNQPLKWDRAAVEAGERRRVFCASMGDVFENRDDLRVERERLFELIARTPNLDWLLLTKRIEEVMRMVPHEWRAGFPRNVWIMATVEDQKRAAERLPVLRELPAVVRGVSAEPLLEDLGDVDLAGVNWVIGGGESGRAARMFQLRWWERLYARARAAGAAPFFKQAGDMAFIDGAQLLTLGKKGHDVEQLPEIYRVREFPVVA